MRWPRKLLHKLLHQVRVRPRLATATCLGLSAVFFLPRDISGATRALVAWDIGSGLYIVLAWTMMLRGTTVEVMRWRSRLQDDGAVAVLAITVAAAVASLAAIFLELVGVKDDPTSRRGLHLALAGVTILSSWVFVHTAFALHYAHEFYAERRAARDPCLQFPGGGSPDYLDFLYFSFVIGTTSQTADVSIASHAMRRLALLHGVVSFFFNATLLALVVNIAASLI
jgi:uncharacterized membrane protein